MDIINLESTPSIDNKTIQVKKREKNIVSQTKETYIHVNSSSRNLVASNILDSIIYNLPLNPLTITSGSNQITINIPNNKLEIDNKIILENAVSTGVSQSFTLTIIDTSLYITAAKGTAGYNLIKYIISTYNINMQVDISGVVGEDSITKELNGLYLFNLIPINLINTRHNLLYSTTINNKLSTIFINLNISPSATTLSGVKTFQLTLLNIGGIPLNEINANYPLDNNHIQGYHDVIAINGDLITIQTPSTATNTIIGGGNQIIVANIINQLVSYPTPDFYEITLLKNFRKVTEIKVISSEIPFTAKNVTTNNNKFYWTNLTDGVYVNSVTIPDGVYTANNLLNTLITNINTIPVYNASNKYHYFSYNLNNLTYTLNSGVSTLLYQPLETDIVVSTSQALTKYMYINFDYHNLSDGDTIQIKNAISFKGIPESVINSTYTVTVVNQNQLKVVLPNYNTNETTAQVNNAGGDTVLIIVPNNIILVAGNFNILSTLGLRATTQYTSSFTNITPILSSLAPYIELRCILPNINNENYNYIDSQPILTKLQFKGTIGEYLYNRHTDISLVFNPPLNDLSTITFQFVYPDGTAVDFSNVDHSFTLLITEMFDTHLNKILDVIKQT
jgi:hypothetical protein